MREFFLNNQFASTVLVNKIDKANEDKSDHCRDAFAC